MSGRLRTNNALLAGGLIAVIAVGALFPFYFTRQGPRARHAGHTSCYRSYNFMRVVFTGVCIAPCWQAPLCFLFGTHNEPAADHLQVDTSKALAGQAGIRGPYTNTGSRDAGPDPDFKPGHFLVVSSLSVCPLSFCKSTERASSSPLKATSLYSGMDRAGSPTNALHSICTLSQTL